MYKFKFADVGEGIHEGVLFEWFVKEGDTVTEGQNLYSVETDKFTTEIPSPVAGKIIKIYYEEGADISVGDVVVDIDDGSGENIETPEKTKPQLTEEKKETKPVTEAASVVGSIAVSDDIIESFNDESSEKKPVTKALATPVARNLAKNLGIDINEVSGTGPNGRVLKQDIQNFADKKSKSPKKEFESPEQNFPAQSTVQEDRVERIKMSKIRETIAKNMERSIYTIPHTSSMYEFDVDDLWALRKEVNDSLKDQNIKLSFMPFIIKALVSALKKHPILNSQLDEENKEIIIKHYYNIGIAIDTPHGLTVPVIREADRMSILEIGEKINELAEQARDKKLSPDSMTDGTFSVTNYGAISGMFGTPVINYPEVAIIGIGSIYKKPVYDENGKIVPKYILPISMSFDHRVVDGADVSRFANTLSGILSSKNKLIIS